jgi:thiopeptide-type bacteriocin biosynthesis protein
LYVALTDVLLRAPLLPERDLSRARSSLEAHALGARAVALASEGAAAASGPARARAWERYGRRAAFRATPQGWLAGVALGRLGPRTQLRTGAPRPLVFPTWARLAALGRALLDDDALRDRVRVRLAPSVLRGATTLRWLAPEEPFPRGDAPIDERVLDLDDALAALVEATADWTPWPRARAAAGGDDLLLALVDEGVLATDLTPPLVGAAPTTWMRARLERLGRREDAAALARGELGRLPGELAGPDVHGVLVHETRGASTLARAAVDRAAALVPLLVRLQDALAPPASERLTQPALDDALTAVTETLGEGALDLEALAVGDYGVELDDDAPVVAAPDARVVAALADAALAAARAGRAEATLDADALAGLFADAGPAPPPTCELFLAPAREPRGAAAGTGWLLGLHAPAGATSGRFEEALGPRAARAAAALADAERAARPPGDEVVDVSFSPSPELADLCAHGRARGRVLALTHWSDGDDDLAPRDLELVAAPGAAAPLALRERRARTPVTPSPRARVRSTTAPPGPARLLAGWSLQRQHAPWALPLGPLAALAHVPRLVLDGFVVSPASWRVPALATRAALRRWRRSQRVPRWVQVGEEDRLMPVDLDDARAADELAGEPRVWEIWPPLGRTVDRGGRRVEAVVSLVARPDVDEAAAAARAARATADAGRVPPPRAAGALPGWRTFKLFGALEHQDAVLVEVVAPVVGAARRARELDGWFVQRYVDGPGRRPHLRLRVRTQKAAAFEARLEAALGPARAAGAVVSVEAGPYHAERARFAGALDAVHAIFEAESELAVVVADDDAPDRVDAVVRALDALASGLGLDLEARRALAHARRDAEGGGAGRDDVEFRARARRLRAALGAPDGGRDALSRALRAHAARARRATRALAPTARAALAPALLHLACVRLAGPDRDVERRAYTFWERTLEGLARAPVRR